MRWFKIKMNNGRLVFTAYNGKLAVEAKEARVVEDSCVGWSQSLEFPEAVRSFVQEKMKHNGKNCVCVGLKVEGKERPVYFSVPLINRR